MGASMKPIPFIIVLAATIASALPARADSPLTATEFSAAYQDHAVVREAAKKEELDRALFDVLAAPGTPIDIKAAVINALGWKIEGRRNSQVFLSMLSERHKKKLDSVSVKTLSADELFCLGYLMAMDDYLHPEKAIPILTLAHYKNRASFTIAIVLALARAQRAMDRSWCEVWRVVEAVLDNGALTMDMREPARKIIVDYMALYKDEC